MADGLFIDPGSRHFPADIKVGDRFEINDPNKPGWCKGWFEVDAFLLDGRIRCKRVEGPRK